MNSVYKILHYPHALLKKKSTPVEYFTNSLRDYVKALSNTMYKFEGGGIASPQVGINKRIFIVDFSKVFETSEYFEKKPMIFLFLIRMIIK